MAAVTEVQLKFSADMKDLVSALKDADGKVSESNQKMVNKMIAAQKTLASEMRKTSKEQGSLASAAASSNKKMSDAFDGTGKAIKAYGGQLGSAFTVGEEFSKGLGQMSGALGPAGTAAAGAGLALVALGLSAGVVGAKLYGIVSNADAAQKSLRAAGLAALIPKDAQQSISEFTKAQGALDNALDALTVTMGGALAPAFTEMVQYAVMVIDKTIEYKDEVSTLITVGIRLVPVLDTIRVAYNLVTWAMGETISETEKLAEKYAAPVSSELYDSIKAQIRSASDAATEAYHERNRQINAEFDASSQTAADTAARDEAYVGSTEIRATKLAEIEEAKQTAITASEAKAASERKAITDKAASEAEAAADKAASATEQLNNQAMASTMRGLEGHELITAEYNNKVTAINRAKEAGASEASVSAAMSAAQQDAIRDTGDMQEAQAKKQEAALNSLQNVNSSYADSMMSESERIVAAYDEKIAKIAELEEASGAHAEAEVARGEARQEMDTAEQELRQSNAQATIEFISEATSQAADVATDIADAVQERAEWNIDKYNKKIKWQQNIKAKLVKEMADIEKRAEEGTSKSGDAARASAIKGELENNQEKLDSNKGLRRQAKKEALDAWKLSKAIKISEAIATGALLALSLLLVPPIGLGPIAGAGLAVGMTTLAVGIMKAEKPPKFHTGGMVTGGVSAGGMVTGTGDEQPAILRKGEAVLNQRATEGIGEEIINALNSGTFKNNSGPINITIQLDGKVIAKEVRQQMGLGPLGRR